MARLLSTNLIVALLISLPLLSACLDGGKLIEGLTEDSSGKKNLDAANSEYDVCVAGKALDTGRIELQFEFPPVAEKVMIFRNGVQVVEAKDKDISTYIDTNLIEGETYKYACEFTVGGAAYKGKKTLTITTLSTNAPRFAGILSAKREASGVRVKWNAPEGSGVATARFRVYATPGASVDWAEEPLQVVEAVGVLEALIPSALFGDELPYALGVRACSKSNACDANVAMVGLAASPDRGAPLAACPTESIVDGRLIVKPGWHPSQGAVKRRFVYLKQSSLCTGPCPSNFSLVGSFTNFDLTKPMAELPVVSTLKDNALYHYYVIDEDPSGNRNTAACTRTFNAGDVTPPPNFAGIDDVINIATPSHPAKASVTVTWHPPTGATPDWSDYLGFRVYNIDGFGNKVLLKDCPCAGGQGCPDRRLSCRLDELDAYRSYRFYVAAYDGDTNETSLDPNAFVKPHRTLDKQAPNFNAEFKFDAVTRKFSWNAATDNQFDAGSLLEYRIFRKEGVSPSDNAFLLTDGVYLGTDGMLKATLPSATPWEDVETLTQGRYFHYLVCARDASGNQTCATNSATRYIGDSVRPTVGVPQFLGPTDQPKTLDDKVWKLQFSLSDNSKSPEDLDVEVYRSPCVTLSSGAAPNDCEKDILPGSGDLLAKRENGANITVPTGGTLSISNGVLTLTGLKGPANKDVNIEYLIVVSDKATVPVEVRASTRSKNIINFESLKPAEGPTSGGNIVIATGDGFTTSGGGTRIFFGTTPCHPSKTIVTQTRIICLEAPAGSGAATVTLQNPDGLVSAGRTYSFTNSPACTGSETGPMDNLASDGAYLICTPQQWRALADPNLNGQRDATGPERAHWVAGRKYRLAAHLDMSQLPAISGAYAEGVVLPAGWATTGYEFYAQLDGDGFAIFNLRVSIDRNAGLLGTVASDGGVRNLTLINPVVAATTNGYVGAVAGEYRGAADFGKNLTVLGIDLGGGNNKAYITTFGAPRCGGIFGELDSNVSSPIENLRIEGNVVVEALTAHNHVGGIIGYAQATNATRVVKNLYSEAHVKCRADYCGGVLGSSSGSSSAYFLFEDAVSVGKVEALGSLNRLGGIAGSLQFGHLKRARFSGALAPLNTTVYVGGLVGEVVTAGGPIGGSTSYYLIEDSHAFVQDASFTYSTVTAKEFFGGIVGFVDNSSDSASLVMNRSSARAKISVTSPQGTVGGLVGSMNKNGELRIADSYFTGEIGGPAYVGGLVGRLRGNMSSATHSSFIERSYAYFKVPTNQSAVSTSGAIGGSVKDSSNCYFTGAGQFTDVFYHDVTNELTSAIGESVGCALPTGAESKTPTQLTALVSSTGPLQNFLWSVLDHDGDGDEPELPCLRGVTPGCQ